MTSADSTYKNVKRVIIWSLRQGLGEFYAQDGGLTGQLGWALLLGQGDDCRSFILGQDQGRHVSLRAWAARKRRGRFLSKGGTRYLSPLPQGPGELLRPVAGCTPLHRHRMVPFDLVELRNLWEGRQQLMALERHFPALGPWAVCTSPVNTVLTLFWVPTHRRVHSYRYTEHWFVNLKHAYLTRTYGTAHRMTLNIL